MTALAATQRVFFCTPEVLIRPLVNQTIKLLDFCGFRSAVLNFWTLGEGLFFGTVDGCCFKKVRSACPREAVSAEQDFPACRETGRVRIARPWAPADDVFQPLRGASRKVSEAPVPVTHYASATRPPSASEWTFGCVSDGYRFGKDGFLRKIGHLGLRFWGFEAPVAEVHALTYLPQDRGDDDNAPMTPRGHCANSITGGKFSRGGAPPAQRIPDQQNTC